MARDPYLVIGLLASLVGLALLFVAPVDPEPTGPGLVGLWWLGLPALLGGLLLMVIGHRRGRSKTRSRTAE